jgi:enediyne biosynthesis protein E4
LWNSRGGDEVGRFDDVSATAGIRAPRADPAVYVFGATFRDLDDDGAPDLAVTADFGRSRMLWNNGDGTFLDGTDRAGTDDEENGMGATTADLDGDGDPDRIVTSVFDPNGSSIAKGGNWGGTGNRVYRNDGDRRFTDVTDDFGLRDGGWGWGVAAFDADNDGAFEVAQVSGIDSPDIPILEPFRAAPSFFWTRDGDSFAEASAEVGFTMVNGRGLAVLDYDGDGRQDLVTARPGSAPRLFRNVSGGVGHWIRVEAVGRVTNREGLHAVVTIRRNSEVILRSQVQSLTDFIGQSERVVHVGLGSDGAPVDIEVEFPATGRRATLSGVSVDQTVRVEEPGR